MADLLTLPALYRLLTFLSPAFPVGAFSYSHGLEQVNEDGDVHDRQSLETWLEDILRFGAGRNDTILLSEAMRAANAGDEAGFCEALNLGLALLSSKERHLESTAQGNAFISAVSAAWPPASRNPAATLFTRLVDCKEQDASREWPYCMAVGLTAAAWSINKEAAAVGFLHAFTANIVSAGIRIIPIGQTEGQHILVSMEPIIYQVAEEALASSLDDLGTSTFLADIASMTHETKYTRLFRT